MADDSCGPPAPPPSAAPTPGGRMVHCVKFGKEMPGLDRPPWKGELGKRIYENVSKDAWMIWIEHSKMIMNEYRLNPLDPQVAENHGRTTRAVLFRRRSQAARRLRRAPRQRLTPHPRRPSTTAHGFPVRRLRFECSAALQRGIRAVTSSLCALDSGCSTGNSGRITNRNFPCASRSAASASSGVLPRAKINPR